MKLQTSLTKKQSLVGAGLIAALVFAISAQIMLTAAHAKPSWSVQHKAETSTRKLYSATLTPDGNDKYTIKNYNGNMFMEAPTTNTGGNLRQVIWPRNMKDYKNSQSCATWVGSTHDRTQQGIALRIRKDDDRVRAITVTKNVIYGVYWVFNIHTWDSASDKPFTQIGQFNMSEVMLNEVGKMEYMPWRVCARAVGDTFSFKISFPMQAGSTSWSDDKYTKSVQIPEDYIYAGQSGWYVGHVPAGGSTEYNSLRIWNKHN